LSFFLRRRRAIQPFAIFIAVNGRATAGYCLDGVSTPPASELTASAPPADHQPPLPRRLARAAEGA